MKKILAVIVIVNLFFSCNTDTKIEGYKITGKISGANNLEMFLMKRVDGEFINLDTAMTDAEGNFVFEGKIGQPEMCYVKINDQKFIQLFVEDSEISLSAVLDSLETMVVEGSLSQEQYDEYTESRKHLTEKAQELEKLYYKAKEEGDTANLNSIIKKFDQLYEDEIAFDKAYMAEHPSSIVTPYLAYSKSYAYNLEELKEVVASLDSSLNQSIYTQFLNDRIGILESTASGKQAIEFSQNDPDGNPISLSSFKGKYLLVDFWASWCGPCRRENPNVVKIYKKYNEKGFEILGVSFDTDKEKWLKAIEKDGLTWSHVSDLQGWNNAAGKIYGIRSIPHTMLIDPEGIIIAHNLTTEELENKLEEIFSAE